MSHASTRQELIKENESLRIRLEEAQGVLSAIRTCSVDARRCYSMMTMKRYAMRCDACSVRAYDLHEAHDGESGLTTACALSPQAILSDLSMSIIRGGEVVRAYAPIPRPRYRWRSSPH